MTKSALVHTLSMNTRCPLLHVTIIAEINGGVFHHHRPPRLMRVASVSSRALAGVAALPLVHGVLTPIFHSCATWVLVTPVGCMVSTSLWHHFAAMRTSSRLVKVSRTTSLVSWITPPLQLGSGGAMRWMNVPIASVRRMTPCRQNSRLLGCPNRPLLRLRAQACLPSAMHPLLSRSQGGGFRAPCPINLPHLIGGKSPNHHCHIPVRRSPCLRKGNYSSRHLLWLPMSQLTSRVTPIWMSTQNSLSFLKGYPMSRGHSTTWRDNSSQIPMGRSSVSQSE